MHRTCHITSVRGYRVPVYGCRAQSAGRERNSRPIATPRFELAPPARDMRARACRRQRGGL
eukprot:3304754-Prymnesium_polylepis.1